MDCTFVYLDDPKGTFDDTVGVNHLDWGGPRPDPVPGVLYEGWPLACVPLVECIAIDALCVHQVVAGKVFFLVEFVCHSGSWF